MLLVVGCAGAGDGNDGSSASLSDGEETSGPAGCGNGELDEDEECDDADANGTGPGWCRADCSGVEMVGDEALYVSTNGDDANAGTREAPLRSIEAALGKGDGIDVFVAQGTYASTETLALVPAVSIFGGYDESNGWSRAATNETIIDVDAPTAVRAADLGATTVLSLLTIRSGDAAMGETSYGVLATVSDGLELHECRIVAGKGGAGTPGMNPGGTGADGAPGDAGEPGCEDSSLACSSCSQPQPGAGGTSICGMDGAAGGSSRQRGQQRSGRRVGRVGGQRWPGGSGGQGRLEHPESVLGHRR